MRYRKRVKVAEMYSSFSKGDDQHASDKFLADMLPENACRHRWRLLRQAASSTAAAAAEARAADAPMPEPEHFWVTRVI